jgi:hypothetical protein
MFTYLCTDQYSRIGNRLRGPSAPAKTPPFGNKNRVDSDGCPIEYWSPTEISNRLCRH